MIATIIIIITICLLLHNHYCVRDAISKFILYCYIIYWNFSLIISCFQPYGMAENQPYTYILLLLGMTSFYVGFCIYGRYNNNPTRFQPIKLYRQVTQIISKPFVIIIQLLCTCFCTRYAIKALIAAGLEEGAIMVDRIDLIFDGSIISFLFYNYIIIPLFYLTVTTLCVVVIRPNKNYAVQYICSTLFIISYMILAGGRSIFIIILMYLFFTYILLHIKKDSVKISKKFILNGLLLSIITLTGMALQTGYRQTGSYSLTGNDGVESISKMGESFLVYSIIPIRLFDIALTENVPEKLKYPYCGRATVAGTDEIVCGLIKRIADKNYESTINIVHYTQDTWISLIPNRWPFNYCYTALFYNYMDFGVIGVIIIPLLLGICFRIFIFALNKYSSLPSFSIVGFGYFMMLHSLFTCYFIKNWVLLFCVGLIIWYYFVDKKPLRFRL